MCEDSRCARVPNLARFIRAERVARQRITTKRKGSRTGASTYLRKFALATLAAEFSRTMQSAEKRGMTIDIDEMIAAHVAGLNRQKAGWIDIALIGNENYPVSITDFKPARNGALLDFIGERPSCFILSSATRR